MHTVASFHSTLQHGPTWRGRAVVNTNSGTMGKDYAFIAVEPEFALNRLVETVQSNNWISIDSQTGPRFVVHCIHGPGTPYVPIRPGSHSRSALGPLGDLLGERQTETEQARGFERMS